MLALIISLTCEILDYIPHSIHTGYILSTKEFKKPEATWKAGAENSVAGTSSVAESRQIATGGQQNSSVGPK